MSKLQNKLFKIVWRHVDNGYSGHGEYCLNESTAKSWVDHMNEKYRGQIIHWMEEKKN